MVLTMSWPRSMIAVSLLFMPVLTCLPCMAVSNLDPGNCQTFANSPEAVKAKLWKSYLGLLRQAQGVSDLLTLDSTAFGETLAQSFDAQRVGSNHARRPLRGLPCLRFSGIGLLQSAVLCSGLLRLVLGPGLTRNRTPDQMRGELIQGPGMVCGS